MNLNAGHTCRKPYDNLYRRAVQFILTAALLLPGLCLHAHAQQAAANAAALQARRVELQAQLRNNAFHEPVYLSSRQGDKSVEGDIYAEIPHSYTDVTAAFKSPATVCELLVLHLNVRACHPSASGSEPSVTISLGPKRAMTSGELYHVTYSLRAEADGPAYFRATMEAAKGPLGTRNYRIAFEAMPIGSKQTFVHLRYAYSYGTMAKMAMDLYLATAGRSKIGFTVIGHTPNGQPIHVGGERGSLERNVMRYYLALLAYSSVTTGSPQEKMEARLRKWHALTERHPAQLHELELHEYLEEKHQEIRRMAASKK